MTHRLLQNVAYPLSLIVFIFVEERPLKTVTTCAMELPSVTPQTSLAACNLNSINAISVLEITRVADLLLLRHILQLLLHHILPLLLRHLHRSLLHYSLEVRRQHRHLRDQTKRRLQPRLLLVLIQVSPIRTSTSSLELLLDSCCACCWRSFSSSALLK